MKSFIKSFLLRVKWTARALVYWRKGTSPSAVRYVVIGTGYMASVYTDIIQRNYDSTVVGVMSRSPERARSFASRFRISNILHDYEDIIALQPDVVYVATPVETHYEIVNELLARRMNVLCEKPLVMKEDEAKKLIEKSENCGVCLIEGMWSFFNPIYEFVFDEIRQQKFGSLTHLNISFSKDERGLTTSIDQDVIFDYGVYVFGLLARVMTAPTVQWSSRHKNRAERHELHCVIVDGDNGARGHVSVCRNHDGMNDCLLYFEKGFIRIVGPFNRATILEIVDYDNKGKRRVQFDTGFVCQNQFVINALRGENEKVSRQLAYTKTTYRLINEAV